MPVALDFDHYHRQVLPGRLGTAPGRAAAADLRDVPPLAVRLDDGRAYRFVPEAGTIRVVAGDTAPVVVTLSPDAWADFVTEAATAAGLVYAGRVGFSGGGHADLERWEPALRALFHGRPIFDPAAPPPRDDLDRAFAADAPPGAMREFLYATGYLHVRAVFARDAVARIAEAVEQRRAAAVPDDGRSWWATVADGGRVVCRLIYLDDVPEVGALAHDPRLLRLASLVDEPVVPMLDRSDGPSVVIKHGGVVEGLADLPWHRDCGLGGHPVLCPGVNVGIQLDAATPERGQLHFVPGSWRASCHRADLGRARTVALATEPGDCTVHLGDVMHAAPPPRTAGPGRRALYLSYAPPRALDVIPQRRGYNDVIRARVGG